jgi:hypothetical protein
MKFAKTIMAVLTVAAGLAALTPVSAQADEHRSHKVCHFDHHHHRVCHMVR